MNTFELAVVLWCAYAIVGAVLLRRIARQDGYFAVFFGALILYSIVAPIGYALVPEFSIVLQMYFGEEALVPALAFSLASLVAVYVGFVLFYRPLIGYRAIVVVRRGRNSGLYLFLSLMQLVWLAGFFVVYFNDLTYQRASNELAVLTLGKPFRISFHVYKFAIFTNLVGYALLRMRVFDGALERALLRFLVVAHLIMFGTIAAKIGSRTDPVALMIGIVMLEVYLSRFATRRETVRRFSVIAMVGVALVGALSLLAKTRNWDSSRDELESSALVQGLLLNDYYTPFHVLIGAIAVDFVEPAKAIVSNLANSLIMFGVPYLQFDIVETFNPGTVTRSASPAMFIFAEGWVIGGWIGFIWNGMVVAAGVALWRLLACSNDERWNALAYAITVCLAITAVRSQSAYFIRNIWMWFIPALALYCVASGARPVALRFTFAAASAPRTGDTQATSGTGSGGDIGVPAR